MSPVITTGQLDELGMNDEVSQILVGAFHQLENEFNSQIEAMNNRCDELEKQVDQLNSQLKELQGKIDGGSY